MLVFMFPYSSFAQSAEELNERITGATDTLYLLAVMWKHAFQDAADGDKRYKALVPFRRYLEDYADKQSRAYRKPSGVDGADSLCDAVANLFEFEKVYVKKGFVPFESLSPGSSEAEVSACRERLNQEGIPERELLTRLNRERRAFAAKNGIDIAPPPAPPKPVYQRPSSFKKKTDTDNPQPAPTPHDQEPALRQQPKPAETQKPVSAERPTSSGNPNAKKAPPAEEDGKTKDKEDSEEEDKD